MARPERIARAHSIDDLRSLAQQRLPRAVFDFFDGGAEDEATLRENRAAFERVRLAPKVLVDVSRIDTTTAILGASSNLPIAIAPTGAVGFGWRGGDVAIARGSRMRHPVCLVYDWHGIDRAHRRRSRWTIVVPGVHPA